MVSPGYAKGTFLTISYKAREEAASRYAGLGRRESLVDDNQIKGETFAPPRTTWVAFNDDGRFKWVGSDSLGLDDI